MNLCVSMGISHVCSFVDDKTFKYHKNCDHFCKNSQLNQCAHLQFGTFCQCIGAYSSSRVVAYRPEDMPRTGDISDSIVNRGEWLKSGKLGNVDRIKVYDHPVFKKNFSPPTRELSAGPGDNTYIKERLGEPHLCHDVKKILETNPKGILSERYALTKYRWACTAFTKGAITVKELGDAEAAMWAEQNGFNPEAVREETRDMRPGESRSYRKFGPLQPVAKRGDDPPMMTIEVKEYVRGMAIESDLPRVQAIMSARDKEMCEAYRDNPLTRAKVNKQIEQEAGSPDAEKEKTENEKNAEKVSSSIARMWNDHVLREFKDKGVLGSILSQSTD